MRDPYEVLEIRRNSSKEEIKAAYKKLAKQYHPDQYGDNPLKDLAEDKMVEINQAYETLMKKADSNSGYYYSTNDNNDYKDGNNTYNDSSYSSTNYSSSSNYSSNSSNSNSTYDSIRTDINTGNLSKAEQKLNSLPFKDAEWNYLMGLLYLKKGWYDSANAYIVKAYNLNPTNTEYKKAYNKLATQNNTYRKNYYGKTSSNNADDICDLCTKLWCLDTLCECAGGDLISCC